MNNGECKVRPEIDNVNGDQPVFFSFSIKTSKISGSCNNTIDPYAKLCVFLMLLKNTKDPRNVMKPVNANIDQIQVFVMISKDGMKINANVNVRN